MEFIYFTVFNLEMTIGNEIVFTVIGNAVNIIVIDFISTEFGFKSYLMVSLHKYYFDLYHFDETFL